MPLQYAASSDWEYVSEGNSRWKHRTSNLEIQAETVIKCRIIRAIDKGSSLVWLCWGLLSSKSWDRLKIARWVPNKVLLFALLLLLILLSVVFFLIKHTTHFCTHTTGNRSLKSRRPGYGPSIRSLHLLRYPKDGRPPFHLAAGAQAA